MEGVGGNKSVMGGFGLDAALSGTKQTGKTASTPGGRTVKFGGEQSPTDQAIKNLISKARMTKTDSEGAKGAKNEEVFYLPSGWNTFIQNEAANSGIGKSEQKEFYGKLSERISSELEGEKGYSLSGDVLANLIGMLMAVGELQKSNSGSV